MAPMNRKPETTGPANAVRMMMAMMARGRMRFMDSPSVGERRADGRPRHRCAGPGRPGPSGGQAHRGGAHVDDPASHLLGSGGGRVERNVHPHEVAISARGGIEYEDVHSIRVAGEDRHGHVRAPGNEVERLALGLQSVTALAASQNQGIGALAPQQGLKIVLLPCAVEFQNAMGGDLARVAAHSVEAHGVERISRDRLRTRRRRKPGQRLQQLRRRPAFLCPLGETGQGHTKGRRCAAVERGAAADSLDEHGLSRSMLDEVRHGGDLVNERHDGALVVHLTDRRLAGFLERQGPQPHPGVLFGLTGGSVGLGIGDDDVGDAISLTRTHQGSSVFAAASMSTGLKEGDRIHLVLLRLLVFICGE